MTVPSEIGSALEGAADDDDAALEVGDDVGVVVISIVLETSPGTDVAVEGPELSLTSRLVPLAPDSLAAVAPPLKPGAVGIGIVVSPF